MTPVSLCSYPADTCVPPSNSAICRWGDLSWVCFAMNYRIMPMGPGADKVPAAENLLSKLEASSEYRQRGPTQASQMGGAVITVTAKRESSLFKHKSSI